MLYDAENLYVLVDVTDDSLHNDSDGAWQDDSVEIYFDGGNTKLDTPLAGDDHQYTFGWATDEIQGTNIDGATEGIEQAQVDTGTGWRIEVKMPWMSIWGVVPKAGDLVGIDCYYNDDDDGGDSRENKMLSFSVVEGWNDASQWATAILAAVEVEKTVLFAEDFEGLALGPNVDEALAGDAVWTDTPPEGWIVDESGIPGIGMDVTDGVTEWAGWAFADKAWWIEAAEDQDRSLFELASGIVAVADPDEWDDDERLPIPISADPYDTWLTTPAIKIAGAEAGTLELKFDSSWRPEFDDNLHQTANITASFDGGEPVVVMLWESDEASENYKPYATNETVIVNLDNPEGAKKVVLTFGLFDAGNDWWWAIDNLEVSGVVPDQEPVDPGTDGLVAYYALDGDPNDSSGNGIDGTIGNADTGGLGLDGSVWVDDPVFGTVISFNGTAEGAFVRAGDIPQMTLTNDFTWAFWAKHSAENTADNDIILGNRYNEDGVDFVPRQFIKFTPTKFEWHMNGNGDDNLDYDDIPADVWLHHAVVKTADQLTYYRNGVEGISGTFTQPMGFPQPLYFGGDNTAAEGENWSGLMSDVGIYDRALSEAEVRYLAGQRATPVDPGDDGLVAFYAFENDANDSSGNGLNGTLVGDAKFAEGPAGYGMALDLDGDGDYVDCGLDPKFDITEQITFTYWIKAVALDKGWNTVLSRGDDSWRSSRAGTENSMEAAVGGTSGNYVLGATLVDDDKWHHVGAVYDGETFSLYVDGELDVSEESTGSITVSSYPLYIGNNSQNTDREWTGLIDEVVIFNRSLSTGEIRYLAGKRAMDDVLGPDVTGPGDIVQGVPDEARDGDVAGWPDGETPDLAADDDIGTKFLHFKGELEPTGIQVEPASGASVVTGLTFTTANDSPERDPISYELSGSNESIDGPYELIASGDIVDFAQEDAWPRFTMNATPISFENGVAYKYYQVMFPAVRDPGGANSMQIAEVELRVSKF
ncbi:MAG: hypothetical protein HQ580_05945 [Planctomycetes bacterium]|nr:hypothetical protein [Planctomycetota bacterium]